MKWSRRVPAREGYYWVRLRVVLGKPTFDVAWVSRGMVTGEPYASLCRSGKRLELEHLADYQEVRFGARLTRRS